MYLRGLGYDEFAVGQKNIKTIHDQRKQEADPRMLSVPGVWGIAEFSSYDGPRDPQEQFHAPSIGVRLYFSHPHLPPCPGLPSGIQDELNNRCAFGEPCIICGRHWHHAVSKKKDLRLHNRTLHDIHRAVVCPQIQGEAS